LCLLLSPNLYGNIGTRIGTYGATSAWPGIAEDGRVVTTAVELVVLGDAAIRARADAISTAFSDL
jgi:hypothetical protein